MGFFNKFNDWFIDSVGNFDYVLTHSRSGEARATLEAFVEGISDALVSKGFIRSIGVFAQRKVTTITSNYTVKPTDNFLIVDASLGNIIITLPTRIKFWDDVFKLSTVLTIKRKDTIAANIVTILPEEVTETIDGDPDVILDTATTPSVNIITDGLNFFTYGT